MLGGGHEFGDASGRVLSVGVHGQCVRVALRHGFAQAVQDRRPLALIARESEHA